MTRIERLTPQLIRNLDEEYSEGLDLMECEDSAITFFNNLKSLHDGERIILMIYAETASERETARLLNVSRTTVRKVLSTIKNKMKKNITYNDTDKYITDSPDMHGSDGQD